MDLTSQRNTSIIIFSLLQSYGTVGVNGTACYGFAAAEFVVYAVNGQANQRIARGFSSRAFNFRAGLYRKGIRSITKFNSNIITALSTRSRILNSNNTCRISIFIFAGVFVVLT